MHQFRRSIPDNVSFRSPRPTPKFLPEISFSQKKLSAGTPRDGTEPPRPPTKGTFPVSRLFFNKSHEEENRPRAVSFRSVESTPPLLQSPHYNAKCGNLYFDQCFDLISKIGEGSFGEVFKVKSKEDGYLYAVKRSRERFRGEGDKRRKLEEVNKHEGLRKHNNCVGFHRAWAEKGHLYIQAELCQMSLEEFCHQNHDIPEKLTFKYLVDLILGLKHLHDHDLLHLDIKPENIFISINGVCKLGDFGLTVDLKTGNLVDAQEGDSKYLAPELLQGKFGKPADVFSLGLTILEVASDLDLPRNGDGWHQLRQGNIPWDLGRNVSLELRSIIQQMIHPHYLQRPTLGQLLSLSKIQQVVKWRRRELFLKRLRSKFLHILVIIWSFFLAIFYKIFMPLYSLKRRYFKSHQSDTQSWVSTKHMRRPSEWDLSFSDDECFDCDLSHGSLGIPLSNSSFSSEEDAPRISGPRTSSRMHLATPTLTPKSNRRAPRSSSPIVHYSPLRLQLFSQSPNVSALHIPNDSPPGTPRGTPKYVLGGTPSKLSSLECSRNDEDEMQHSVGPRSLQLAFEEAEDSE